MIWTVILVCSILAAILFVVIAISLIVSCYSNISLDRTNHNYQISVVDFDQFLSYYRLNPDAYDLNDKYYPIRNTDGWSWHAIHVHFNRFSDHLRYHFWRKREIRNRQKRSQCTEKYLKLVMEDIEKMRKLSAKELDEAQQEIERVSLNIAGR